MNYYRSQKHLYKEKTRERDHRDGIAYRQLIISFKADKHVAYMENKQKQF